MSDLNDSLPPAPPSIPQKKKGISVGRILGLVLGVVACVALLPVILSEIGSRMARDSRGLRQVRARMQSLEMAVRSYQTEYNRLPSFESPPPLEDNAEGYETTSEHGRRIVATLMGTDTLRNPRKVAFYEPPPMSKNWGGYTEADGLVDLWGIKGYIILLDYNGDQKIADPEHPGETIAARVIIYSAGPDSDFSTWHDNLKSWE